MHAARLADGDKRTPASDLGPASVEPTLVRDALMHAGVPPWYRVGPGGGRGGGGMGTLWALAARCPRTQCCGHCGASFMLPPSRCAAIAARASVFSFSDFQIEVSCSAVLTGTWSAASGARR
jgi:hypothetical protein